MTIDTVTDDTPRRAYTATTNQVTFAVPFPFYDPADLVVSVGAVAKVLNTDYSVDGAGDDTGGFVTFFAGRTAGDLVVIYRETAIERVTEFGQNGPILTESLNDEFNHITIVQQELRDKAKFAIHAAFNDGTGETDLVLPAPAARKGLVLSFDPTDGKALTLVTQGGAGPQGIPGAQGNPGVAGPPGTAGSVTADGVRTVSLTRTSTVTLTADPLLSLVLAAGSYELSALLLPFRVTNPDLGGMKISILINNTAGAPSVAITSINCFGKANGSEFNNVGGVIDITTVSNANDYINVHGTIIRDAPFIIAVYWSQHSSTVDGVTMAAGSRLSMRKIS